jgi:protoheme IX farnesyltransferase
LLDTPISDSTMESCSPAVETDQVVKTKPKGNWRDYISVTKTGIVVSNSMTVFAGLWIASDGPLNPITMLLTMLGSALVIMSGTSLNNYIERDYDLLMERTKTRALPDGRLTPQSVLILGIVLGIIGMLMLIAVNMLTAVMGLVALFFYVVVYTMWTKRTTTLNTLVGAVSGAMPPVMGYTAVTGTLDTTAGVLFGILFIWQCPHFLALAMRRADEYKGAGFQMLPSVYGFEITKRQILQYTALLIPVTLMLYALQEVGKVYLIGMSVLGIGYLIVNISGFFTKDDIKFARKSFVYSLVYLMMFTIFILIDRV